MASVNKVILMGNLGRDPEVRYSPDGGAIANVSIATTSRYKDKTSGDMKEDTEWHRVVFFGRLAEIAGEYLKRADPSMWRVACAHENGRISRARSARPLKSWPTRCNSLVVEMAQARVLPPPKTICPPHRGQPRLAQPPRRVDLTTSTTTSPSKPSTLG